MRLYGADALGKLLVSSDVAGCRQASRPAGMLSCARMSSQDWKSLYISSQRRMAHTCKGMQRKCQSYPTGLVLLCCQM